ncbi:MAG: phosphoribosylformylglycinamidine synthase subunit PurQ [Candidatus Diapherotrites archaeon]|nr:phosphoribosylformylglycinamidine synthase subunit PurQ [Candidatus Diapherotrites archaeon]
MNEFSNNKPKAMILTGEGINCENETAHAFTLAGADASIVRLSDILSGKANLLDFDIFCVPGGFSFGDDLGSGKVFASRLQNFLERDFEEFVESGRLGLGICNGAQILMRTGIFGLDGKTTDTTLTFNDCGHFHDRWIKLKINPNSKCVFTKGIDLIDMPIRHGEGKFVVKDNATLEQLLENQQIVSRYVDENGNPATKFPQNPNGSIESAAMGCNKKGNVMWTMPHPEGTVYFCQHPNFTRKKETLKRAGQEIPIKGDGLKIFENAVEFAKEKLI